MKRQNNAIKKKFKYLVLVTVIHEEKRTSSSKLKRLFFISTNRLKHRKQKNGIIGWKYKHINSSNLKGENTILPEFDDFQIHEIYFL